MLLKDAETHCRETVEAARADTPRRLEGLPLNGAAGL